MIRSKINLKIVRICHVCSSEKINEHGWRLRRKVYLGNRISLVNYLNILRATGIARSRSVKSIDKFDFLRSYEDNEKIFMKHNFFPFPQPDPAPAVKQNSRHFLFLLRAYHITTWKHTVV